MISSSLTADYPCCTKFNSSLGHNYYLRSIYFLWSQDWISPPLQCRQEWIVFSIKVLSYILKGRKKSFDSYLTSYINLNSWQTVDLNLKDKIIKLLKIIWGYRHNSVGDKDVLKSTKKAPPFQQFHFWASIPKKQKH